MALNLKATRKDKPLLGFFKESPPPGAVETVRKAALNPRPKSVPEFRSTRSRPIEQPSP